MCFSVSSCSTNGWQFCGSPSGKVHDIAVSWDGYALVLPLPAPLLAPGNPWYNGIPKPEGFIVPNTLTNAYAPQGKHAMK